MNIFCYIDYKKYVNEWIQKSPRSGYGTYKKIAQALGTSSTAVSQVFKGQRHLSLEQGKDLSEYFSHTDLETRHFLLMLMYGRSGTHKLSQYLNEQLRKSRIEGENLKNILKTTNEFDEKNRAIFYSHWLYSAVRNLAATSLNSVDDIADHLGVSRLKVEQITNFLLQHGLCKFDKEGNLTYGTTRTHIERDSLLCVSHHNNWRQYSISRNHSIDHEQEIGFTFPMTVSHRTAKQIQQELIKTIKKINELVEKSDSETCACLNIDWLKF